MKKINTKKNIIFYISISIFLVLFFSLLGEHGYYEYTDSSQYIVYNGAQGVMPTYPLFIRFHKVLLGEEIYLYGVVVSQTLIAIACLMCFLVWIRERFGAGYIVSLFALLVSLVPFTLDYPIVLVNHSIITEALAYPFFYLFVIIYMETILRKQFKWVALTTLAGIAMSLIRTQMQVCFIFSAVTLIYVVLRRSVGLKKGRRALVMLGTCAICGFIVLISEMVMLYSSSWMRLKAADFIRAERRRIEQEKDDSELQLDGEIYEEKSETSEKNIAVESEGGAAKQNNEYVTGQFDSVLIDRTFYEMEKEDAELFSNQDVKKLYLKVFEIADEEKNRYVYARDGLWKWQDIMNGTAGGTNVLQKAWDEYLKENPQTPLAENRTQVNRTLAFELLKKHWGRMLYHTLCMLPQGFICTVFFQIEEIYGLCHLYTLLIYLFSTILIIWGFKKKIPEERLEFMCGVLSLNILMVVVVCIIFFGMQRYLIYGFGVFYTALLLMLEELWKAYGRTLWKKARSRF